MLRLLLGSPSSVPLDVISIDLIPPPDSAASLPATPSGMPSAAAPTSSPASTLPDPPQPSPSTETAPVISPSPVPPPLPASENSPSRQSGAAGQPAQQPPTSAPSASRAAADRSPSPRGETLPDQAGSKLTPVPPITSGQPLPAPPAIAATPGNGSSGSPETRSPTNQVAVDRISTPAEFSVSILNTTPASNAGDLPQYPPTPHSSSQTFRSDPSSASGCLLDPVALRAFGSAVGLRITVDRSGQVFQVNLQESSHNETYDQLAICTIKTWKFSPAYNLKDGAKDFVFSNLDIRIVLRAI